ncbi:MAG: zf-HC2 domain-containing protein [Gemmatimonadota bacterium]|nr:zf-HC2 domain-containing protein [Gemmatimonadota bacterium]MDH3421959.1 zf-HC2 domain-containing protein [Gemmatimonadota bacterium]
MNDVRNNHPSTDRLQAFLDGSVPSRERRRLEAHVTTCAQCSDELATWRVLFEDLDGLRSHRPSADFQARVMSGVQLPVRLPLAARVKATLAALRPASRPVHLGAGVLQDLADGVLVAREAQRAQAHLGGCVACSADFQGWTTVLARLSELDRFDPMDGFADRVIAGLTPAASRAPVRQPGWARALASARRFLPRSRRAWAAIAGAAVTPAVTFGLVLFAVFSHPTLTPQALVSFTYWQFTDLFAAAWNGLLATGLAATGVTGLDGFVDLIVGSPLLAATGVAIYAAGSGLALRVLYKNLIDSRSIRPRYASVAS